MIKPTRLKGVIGIVIVLQIISLLTRMEEWSLIKRINSTTTKNAELLASHSESLRRHDMQFDAIFAGMFSEEFVTKIKRNLSHVKR